MSLISRPSPLRTGRPARALIGAATAAALVVGVGAGTAAASADGCTYTEFPHEYVCASVTGKKLNVEKVEVVRGKLPAGVIDDYHGEANVYTPAGKHYVFTSSVRTGKRYTRAHVTIRINRSFPNGSKICGAFFERDSWIDSACFKIHD
ncbi:MAG: hypothetical protein QOD86_627 [Miltoncostaeaceae bacterium]|jgi:hypothetical protein|nr:hypothetical protein [Miltoncostaeaceae bacterium]